MKKRSKILIGFCALVVAMISMSLVAFAANDLQKPGTVTGVKQIDSSENSIKIEWTADITPNCYYDVWMSTTGDEGTFVKKNTYRLSSPDMFISNLTPGTTYYIKVIAFTYNYSAGELYADNYSETIPVATTPEEATGVKQTAATASSVTLKWDKVSGATGYYVYNGNGSDKKLVANVTTNSATIKKLKATGKYNFYVYPYRKAGNYVAAQDSYGSKGYISDYDVKLIPGKVSAGSIDVEYYWSALKEMKVNWKKVSRAEGYQVQVYLYNGKKASFTTAGTSNYAYLEKMQVNRFYKIKVRAYTVLNGAKKYGSWSSYSYEAFNPDVFYAKQDGSKKQAKIKWDTVKGATSYTVYASTKQKSGYKKIATAKKTSLTLSKIGKTSLKKNKTYYVYVVANRKVGKTTYTSGGDYCWSFKLTR